MKSSFDPVSPQVDFPAIEASVLDFWKKDGTFSRSLAATADGKPFVFYDGPPFANGLPHYGHLLPCTLKDIVPRYWTMRGFSVDRRFGWDCHGLPVENEMEKEFALGGKRDIEKLGIHIFNEACRSIVLRYTSQWEIVVNRIGRWVDFVNQYRTMDPPYMETIWWVFKQVWDAGLIYRGFRVQPYCPRCATPLSNFEVNQGYKDTRGPSITVSFPLRDEPGTNFLVWTTTPWTLPSNVALAVGPDVAYVKIRDKEAVYILARDRLTAYFKDPSAIEVIDEFPGSKLQGVSYVPMFDFFADRHPGFFKVTTADFVSTEDGSGIVHIAPAFGEDDFGVGKKLDLPIVCPVDEEGKFTDEVAPWKGMLVFDADTSIIEHIKKAGRLVHRGQIEHRYPFCYRCDTPLIYKAITTWFLKIEPLRANMQANNQQIRWVPPHLQNGRFGKGIESAPDWNISRNRYWGTPIPLYDCDCGQITCVGSLSELHALAGKGDVAIGAAAHKAATMAVQKDLAAFSAEECKRHKIDPLWSQLLHDVVIDPTDLHRHVIDRVTLFCPTCGKELRRTSEVLDCWFESGSMPYAQVHYPFENRQRFEAGFPADFIAEGLDQTRGWFYSLTVIAAALFKKPAFKNVIVNGTILSEEGVKLSKRLRNYTPPQEVLDKLGADALRLFLINSPAVKAEDLRFSEKGVQEMSRQVLLPFYNAYVFFVTYANVDNWQPGPDAHDSSENELDQWIISLLNHCVRLVNEEMEQYNLYKVVPLLVDFVDNLTNWYIRRSRRRFWKSESDSDKKCAYNTLYFVLIEFSKVMAPFLPFLTESIYRNLAAKRGAGTPQSVHLCSFPKARPELDKPQLEERMSLTRQVVAMGRTLRSRFTIKNRQPLSAVTVMVTNTDKRRLLFEMESLIIEELNVKSLIIAAEENFVTLVAKPNFKLLGKIFGPRMKEAATLIEALPPARIREIEAGGSIEVLGTIVTRDHLDVRRIKNEGVEVETVGELTVALTTTITPKLLAEGRAREFVNRVQNLRKEKDFAVSDRIAIKYQCDDILAAALLENEPYICSETLATACLRASGELTDCAQTEVDDIPLSLFIAVDNHASTNGIS